ncbi:MAG: S1 RNA-binding domain-containing protein [Eubacteriales bacterium]
MDFTVGMTVEGTVKSITKFGAFIALPENGTGLVHISEIAHTYVNDVSQHLSQGQEVKVMVIGTENGKINLSIKRTMEQPKFERPAQNRQFSDRPRPQFDRPKPQFDRPRPQNDRPRQSFAPRPAAPKEPATFDDMLKQFMTESDTKISGIKQYSEHKKRRR